MIEKASVGVVATDPVAREHVLGKLLRRVGKPPAAPGLAPSGRLPPSFNPIKSG